jgi:hypothetical protein
MVKMEYDIRTYSVSLVSGVVRNFQYELPLLGQFSNSRRKYIVEDSPIENEFADIELSP